MGTVLVLLTALAAVIYIIYYIRVSYRQEKAILVLFLQEFTLLLRRSAMYYGQMLKGKISFSTLFEITDASLYGKLAEVVKDPKIIETALDLRAQFFQVIRYANMASDELAKSDMPADKEIRKAHKSNATKYQSLAIIFFAGDMFVDGQFSRAGIDDIISKISSILKYLDHVNSRLDFLGPLVQLSPTLSDELTSTHNYVKLRTNELELIREKAHLLREKEKLLFSMNERKE